MTTEERLQGEETVLKDSCGQRLGRKSTSCQGNTFILGKPGFRGTADCVPSMALSHDPQSACILSSRDPLRLCWWRLWLRSLCGRNSEISPASPFPSRQLGGLDCRWVFEVWGGYHLYLWSGCPCSAPLYPNGGQRTD